MKRKRESLPFRIIVQKIKKKEIPPEEIRKMNRMDLVELVLREWTHSKEKPKYFELYERKENGFTLVIIGKSKKHFLKTRVIPRMKSDGDAEKVIRVDEMKDSLSKIDLEIRELIHYHLRTEGDSPAD